MAFRFLRRFRVAPGTTLNLSKSGPSLSFGPRGAKMTFGSKGIRRTLGLGDNFRMIISVPEFGENPAKTSRILPNEKVTDEAHDKAHDEAHDGAHDDFTWSERRILEACLASAKTTPELLAALGYASRTGNFKRGLKRLLALKYLEPTIPDKPRSKNQSYRLTSRGRSALGLPMRSDS